MQTVPLAMSQRGAGLEIAAPTTFISRQCDYPQRVSWESTEIHLKLPPDTADSRSCSSHSLSLFYRVEAASPSLLT